MDPHEAAEVAALQALAVPTQRRVGSRLPNEVSEVGEREASLREACDHAWNVAKQEQEDAANLDRTGGEVSKDLAKLETRVRFLEVLRLVMHGLGNGLRC